MLYKLKRFVEKCLRPLGPKHFLKLLLYYLNAVFPKKKYLWLAGAWNGTRYTDNARYLFEYICQSHSDIDTRWITTNKSIYERLKTMGFPVIYAYSLSGVWLLLRARVYIFSSCLKDVSWFGAGRKTFRLQLWHGSPLKKIVCDNPLEWREFTSRGFKRHLFLCPYDGEKYDAVICPSPYFQRIFQSAFRWQAEDFPVLGYPRIDKLLSCPQLFHRSAPRLLYAPTFRGTHLLMREVNSLAMPTDKDLANLDHLFASHHAHMEVQYHPVDAQTRPITGFQHISHIKPYDDFYNYLQSVDILITDYSGLMFDFMLTKKPVICLIADIDRYISEDRELYRHPADVPGVYVCYSWAEVYVLLADLLNNGVKSDHVLSEEEWCEVYAFKDNAASQRIADYIKQRISY